MAQDEKYANEDEHVLDDFGLETVYDSSKGAKCDVWGIKHGSITVSNNNLQTTAGWSGYVQWTFGKDLIASDSDDIHRWEFSIDSFVGGGYYFEFGIVSNPQGFINGGSINYSSNLPGNYYCVWMYKGQKYCHLTKSTLNNYWNEGCKTGDKVIMQLDCKKKELLFWKNNKFMGIAYNNIDFKGIDGYHLAVGLSYTSDKLSLLKYQKGKAFPSMKNDFAKITKCYENAIKNGTKLMYLLGKNEENSKNSTDSKTQTGNKEELSVDMIVKISQEIGNYSELIPRIEKQHDELCGILKQITENHSDICKPDVKKYETWELNEIIFWIMSLENGRYQKYIEKLTKSFKENQIGGKDLPHLTRQDLHVSFGIAVFRDRMDLEKHFQKLANDEVDEGE